MATGMSSDAGRLPDCTFPTRPPSQSESLHPEAPFHSTTVLHTLSFLTASLILGLATQDAGLCSLGLNPFFAILTIAYHTIILALIFMDYSSGLSDDWPGSRNAPHIANPFVAALLSLAWLGAYIAMAIVLATRALVLPLPAIFFGTTPFKGNALVFNGQRAVFQLGTIQLAIPQTTRVTQKIQILCSMVACVLLGNIAVRGVLDRVRGCKERGLAFV